MVDQTLAKSDYAVNMKMQDCEAFKAWMLSRGRSAETAHQYAKDVLAAFEDGDDPLVRLRNKLLAPNTLARIKAALSAWARFQKDNELTERLKDFLLPAARRLTPRVPLTKDEWRRLVKGIDSDHEVSPAIRAVIALMAIRGFRVGDILRIKRREAQTALRTGMISFEGKKRIRTQYDVSNFREHFQKLLDEGSWERVANIVSDKAVVDPQHSARHAVAVAFKKIGKNAGFDPRELYPHRLRRSYATYYLEAVGNDLERLRQHMGWANVATAAKYVDHVDQKVLDATATRMIDGLLNSVDKSK